MLGETRTAVRSPAPARVIADAVLPLPADVAADRLARVFHTDDHEPVLMSVGPGRHRQIVGKRVRADLVRRPRRGNTEVFALHWEPVGTAAAAYPTLDARLGITPVNETSSLLSVVARYRPPLGALGATVDRAALSRVADATVASVLHRLAAVITRPSRPVVRSVRS